MTLQTNQCSFEQSLESAHSLNAEPSCTLTRSIDFTLGLKHLAGLALVRSIGQPLAAQNYVHVNGNSNDSDAWNAHSKAQISQWLELIEETSLEVVELVYNRCATDNDALKYYLWRAKGGDA